MTVSTASNDYCLRNSSRIKFKTIRMTVSTVSNYYYLGDSTRTK